MVNVFVPSSTGLLFCSAGSQLFPVYVLYINIA